MSIGDELAKLSIISVLMCHQPRRKATDNLFPTEHKRKIFDFPKGCSSSTEADDRIFFKLFELAISQFREKKYAYRGFRGIIFLRVLITKS